MSAAALLPYLRLLRLPAVVTAWADILAAHLIATGGAPVWPLLAAQLAATTALYWAGMVLNDCFDLAEDRRERPQRPLPSGAVPTGRAWGLGWLLLAGGLPAAAAGGGRLLAVTLPLALAILAYDGWLKRHWTAVPAMGLCRYLNWLLGLAVLPIDGAALLLALPIFLYVAAVTALSRAEARAQDRRALGLCAAGLVLTLLCAVLLHRLGLLPHAWPLVPLALLAAAGLGLLARLRRAFTPQRVQAAVRLLLLGIVPLDALLATAGAPWWSALPILLLLVPGRLLSRAIAIT